MDMSATTAPKSDQLNYDDLTAGPITVTVTGASKGNNEQPVNIHLAEFPRRAFRPSKSMRRVMVAAWGKETDNYTGGRLTLYGDPDVTYGGQKVGGIKISHMSGIAKPVTALISMRRGQRGPYTVQPLAADAPRVTPELIAAATTIEELRAMWDNNDPTHHAAINARVNELQAAASELEETGE